MRVFSFAALLFCGVTAMGMAGNWPQFRGPNAAGVSPEAVPVTWSETENLRWRTALPGRGSSSPVVWEDAVFVTCYRGSGADLERLLLRIDRRSGEVIWQRAIPVWHEEDPARGFILEHGWASNTPATDGERVYGYFGKAGIYAFDLDGELAWKRETGSMSSSRQWGSASSPILHDGKLIVPAGDEARAILALDVGTGEEIWRAPGQGMAHTYGTPIVSNAGEGRTDLVFAATGEVWGLNPETGKLRWFAAYNLPGNMSNTIVETDGVLTVSGGYPRTARVAIRPGGEGDRSSELLYDTQKPASYMTAPVLHEGVLYWVSDSGIAFAARPGEAEALWTERIPGLTGAGGRGKPFYASPVLAGGRIYAQSRANGVVVIEPNLEGLKIVAQNRIASDDTLFNATPAVSQGCLFLRSQTHLYCVGD